MCTITLLDRSVGRPLRLFLPPGCVVCVMYLSSTARDTVTRSRKAWYFSSIQYRSLRSIHDSATRFKYVWFSGNCQLILLSDLSLQPATTPSTRESNLSFCFAVRSMTCEPTGANICDLHLDCFSGIDFLRPLLFFFGRPRFRGGLIKYSTNAFFSLKSYCTVPTWSSIGPQLRISERPRGGFLFKSASSLSLSGEMNGDHACVWPHL